MIPTNAPGNKYRCCRRRQLPTKPRATRRAAVEQLEARALLTTSADLSYDLLNDRVQFNQENFYVYQDVDSGFNHGFPSGFFGNTDRVHLNTSCIDAPNAADGSSTDPNRLDRVHGTVMQFVFDPLLPGEFSGVHIEEPKDWQGGNNPGQGYDLRGATELKLDVRAPDPDGIWVQFEVAGKPAAFQFIPHRTTFQEISIPLNAFGVTTSDLSSVHQLFTVVTNDVHAPNGGVLLVDNVRFTPVPNNPTGGQRLSFPVGNETFGVSPAAIRAVDDADAGFTTTGSWSIQAKADAYGGQQHAADNIGTDRATWTIPGLQPRIYQIQVTWAPSAANATNARFEIFDGSQSRSVTLVDQTSKPVGSTFNGRDWQTIGSLQADSQYISGDEISSGKLKVVLSNQSANGLVVADGIRIVPTIPPDQALRNLTTVYESSLTLDALLARGNPDDLANARLIADSLLYALHHDNTGGGAQLPPAPDGSHGLRDAYSSGDLATRNSQANGGAQAGEARLAGFTTDPRLADHGFALVLDGAFGGNNAFGIMALMSAYLRFGDRKYLDGAEEIGNWIYGSLRDPNGPDFPENLAPGPKTYGGYFLGYEDQGVEKTFPAGVIRGKSIENNADIFAAFSMIANAESRLGHSGSVVYWTKRANIAGDFVMALYDAGDPAKTRDGHFNAGVLPATVQPGPGLEPDQSTFKGGEVINKALVLDSNTFTVLALARAPRYEHAIDWREPLRFAIDKFRQEVDAVTDGVSIHYEGFNIARSATTSEFRPGGPIDGLPEGIAWEFTAQMVTTMRILDGLYSTTEFAAAATHYMSQITKAQRHAPFGDGRGFVAATVDGENDSPQSGYAPLDQVLGTPFQAIAERVGLAATNWAIYADRAFNPFDFVNDAPVLDNSLSPRLVSTKEDALTPSSTLVANLLTGAVTDPDLGALRGIAVTAASTTHGTWQFSVNGGKTWQAIGTTSESAARLIPGWARLRFIPKQDFNGTVNLYYRAWDQTQGAAGGTVSLINNVGGTTAFSIAKENAALVVKAVNDPPQISFSGSVSYVHDKPAIALVPYATVADVDSPNFGGGRLLVKVTDGASSSNRLTIGAAFTIDATGNVKFNGTIIGRRTANGVGTNELIVVFNNTATKLIVQELVRAIQFKTVNGTAGLRKVSFRVSDGDGGLSSEMIKPVNVI